MVPLATIADTIAGDPAYAARRLGVALDAALGRSSGTDPSRWQVRTAAPPRMHVRGVRLNSLGAIRLTTRPLTLELPRATPAHQCQALFLFVEGGTVDVLGESTRSLAPGARLCAIAPGSAPVVITAMTEARMLLFSFDQGDVAPLTFSEQTLREHVDAGLIGRVAFAYLAELTQAADADGHPVRELRELTREIARSLVRVFTTPAAPGDTTVQRARRIMERVYARPDVGVEDIAQELGVSRRALERSFAAAGQAVAAALRDVRTQHAIAAMARDPARPLREIAAENGFGSIDSFRRAVRTRSPSVPG